MTMTARLGAWLSLAFVGAVTATVAAQSNCVQWVLTNPANRPTPRYAHAMTYDSQRGVVVLFGGNIAGGIIGLPIYANDTWEYNGTNWVQRNVSNPPPVRGTGSMVFDSQRNVCVLFGGQNAGGRLGDLWEYNGLQWTQRSQTGARPSPRVSHFMAYDSQRRVTVLFGGAGGFGGPAVLQGDTWEWNGAAWQQRTPLLSPLPRAAGAMDYDSARGKVVMFAGGGNFGGTAETWEYDGTTWGLRFSNVAFWRVTPAMCFDRARGVMFAFAGILGNIRYQDEFAWNGAGWWHDDIPGPMGRSDAVMAYDSQRRTCVLFGGESQQPARLNDTWELRNNNPIVVTDHPDSQTVPAGAPVLFAVSAQGTGLSYQWRRQGMALPGQIGTTLYIPSAAPGNAGRYDVMITNTCGVTVSNSAQLQISGGGSSGCLADFNGDGFRTPDDLSDFFLEFFSFGPRSDFNGDGFRTPDDLADFVSAFFAGC